MKEKRFVGTEINNNIFLENARKEKNVLMESFIIPNPKVKNEKLKNFIIRDASMYVTTLEEST